MGSTTGTLDELEENRFKSSNIRFLFQLELRLCLFLLKTTYRKAFGGEGKERNIHSKRFFLT